MDNKVKEDLNRLNLLAAGMTEERIQLLEAEGFVWDQLEIQWFEKLEELKDYKLNHGEIRLCPSVTLKIPPLDRIHIFRQ